MAAMGATNPWLMAGVGGCILGASTSIYLAMVGRVTGMSGTIRQAFLQLTGQIGLDGLHLVYAGGLLLGGSLARVTMPFVYEAGGYSWGLMFGGGLLVGLGTTIGHGCTSGHGLCGLSRFSKRSLVAVCTFFGTALVTATSVYPVMKNEWIPSKTQPNGIAGVDIFYYTTGLGAVLAAYGATKIDVLKSISTLVCSVTFALGLCISGMTKPTKIHYFLALYPEIWDPSLAFVMGGGVAVGVALWPAIQRWNKPLAASHFDLPTKTEFEWGLVSGGVIFGLGWALSGLCPGPAIVALAGEYGSSQLVWMGGFILGSQAAVVLSSMNKGAK
eukprot:CAMPEP_0197524718 /NCGR_PEP_ID=MMETSP1318-20131121/9295_1 /TAXON_ID=552666 /ORGANISM="Partenskyella glossopodia, Strain RCC365" /LENGTH=328 /DNA_ID=CAMNT_0043077717 /DNA_START=45 /DNA_END=1031 /DNA_ORIENTATION=+